MTTAHIVPRDLGRDVRWDSANSPAALLQLLRDFDKSRPQRAEEIQAMEAGAVRFDDPRLRYATLAVSAGHHVRSSSTEQLASILASAKAHKVDDETLDWARWRLVLSEAILAAEQGEPATAERLALDARDLAARMDDGDLLSETYSYLAALARAQKMTANSLRYAHQAIAAGSPTSWGRAGGAGVIAATFHHHGAAIEAMQIQRYAITADRNRPLNVARGHLALAVFAIDARRLDTAAQALRDGARYIEALGSPPRLRGALAVINAKFAASEQRYTDAAVHLDEFHKIDSAVGATMLKSEREVVLVRLAMASRRHENALSIAAEIDIGPLAMSDRQFVFRLAAEAAEVLQKHDDAKSWLWRLADTYHEPQVKEKDLTETLALLDATAKPDDATTQTPGGKATQARPKVAETLVSLVGELEVVTARRGGSIAFTFAGDDASISEVPLSTVALSAVLRNLVNGVVLCSASSPLIGVSASFTDQVLRIEVADSDGVLADGAARDRLDRGAGIRDECRRDFQRRDRGSGFGLFHTKRLVESVRGRIGVTDDAIGRLTFWIELPRRRTIPNASPPVAR